MKIMEVVVKKIIFFVVCFLLSGCGKIVKWVQDSLPQIQLIETHCNKAAQYIKSVTLYDQFSTVGMFDALWLSDEVRLLYVDLLTSKFGKSNDQKKALLRRQLEENNHFISFYVLSLYEFPLGDTHNTWTLFLSVDDKNYPPMEVKSVELPSEYVCIFDKKYNRFKFVYSVKFDAKDMNDLFILSPESLVMKLVFRSTKKEIILECDLQKKTSD